MSEGPSTVVAPQPAVAAYRCRKCRLLLFSDLDVATHDTCPTASGHKNFRFQSDSCSDRCTSLFLADPHLHAWLYADTAPGGTHQGDCDIIHCPSCGTKIGSRSWVGSQCSCGAWVVPSFKVHHKMVDEVPL